MKFTKKVFKDLHLVYLYADGHTVFCYEKKDKETGIPIQWVDVYEDIGIQCSFPDGKGRLIIREYIIPFLVNVDRIRVMRGTNRGSTKTIEQGIFVEEFQLFPKGYHNPWRIHTFPGLLISDIEWNAIDAAYSSDTSAYYFGDMKIRNIYPKEEK